MECHVKRSCKGESGVRNLPKNGTQGGLIVFSISLYFEKFFDESIVWSRSAFIARALAESRSFVRLSRATGAELRPAVMPAMEEKLFKERHSCMSVHDQKGTTSGKCGI